ncbi:DUF6777 domain-containing protein [Streptomyces sp. NPDC048419]|uniref:DUF6777 domain-containing protein n=1 Tax=Streptomyces sp. NPDC048419 TaxID=3365547 RepID=UPI00371BB363
MRTATRTLATACLLSAALLVAGCSGSGEADTKAGAEVFLQPVADRGPDPFTGSTVVPSPVTGPAQPDDSARTDGSQTPRAISGSMPGLYAGTVHVGSCDVDRQIGQLTSDQAKARAFAQVAGVPPASLPDYLRGLAPVELRADTLVTNHGYRGGRTTSFQSVLQAGTAVLVDNRGMPRVRCACGNPLQAAGTTQGGRSQGAAWPGYRPAQVIVVTPTPQVITDITIIDVGHRRWIERHVGHDVQHDHVVPPPATLTPRPTPSPDASASGTGPSESPGGTSPGDRTPSPSDPSGDCTSPEPTVTVQPGATDAVTPATSSSGAGGCPTATASAVPPTTTTPGHPRSSPATPSSPNDPASPANPDETGPDTVPDNPDQPDSGGLIPDDTTTSIIFDSPTGVLQS